MTAVLTTSSLPTPEMCSGRQPYGEAPLDPKGHFEECRIRASDSVVLAADRFARLSRRAGDPMSLPKKQFVPPVWLTLNWQQVRGEKMQTSRSSEFEERLVGNLLGKTRLRNSRSRIVVRRQSQGVLANRAGSATNCCSVLSEANKYRRPRYHVAWEREPRIPRSPSAMWTTS